MGRVSGFRSLSHIKIQNDHAGQTKVYSVVPGLKEKRFVVAGDSSLEDRDVSRTDIDKKTKITIMV